MCNFEYSDLYLKLYRLKGVTALEIVHLADTYDKTLQFLETTTNFIYQISKANFIKQGLLVIVSTPLQVNTTSSQQFLHYV